MGGTKTQIPHPGAPGDLAYQIPQPLGDGRFQNSIIFKQTLCRLLADNSPISVFSIGILVVWVELADQSFFGKLWGIFAPKMFLWFDSVDFAEPTDSYRFLPIFTDSYRFLSVRYR